MKQINLRHFACKSFVKNLKAYFTPSFIIKGFINSILLSAFIFLALFEIKFLQIFGCICGVFGIYKLLGEIRQIYFWSGFFVGILWFYWMSFSLIYFEFTYLIPLEIVGIGLVYGLIFWFCGFFKNQIWQIFGLFFVSFIHPFGFNWLNFALFFVDTPFAPSFWTLGGVILALGLIKQNIKFGSILLIFVFVFSALTKQSNSLNLLPFEVELIQSQISQLTKWKKSELNDQIKANLDQIYELNNENLGLIVFPETAFPLYLNQETQLNEILKQLSLQTPIITGALAYENDLVYNSAYFFSQGQMQRFDKVVLVPFGEEIPLPKTLKNLINKIFFDGASDFSAAQTPSDYEIDGIKIRNAICYEATRYEIYKDNPKFVVAISNNAWFKPSTEPVLQKLLMKYYAYNFGTTIYHAANGSKSEIITP